MSRISRALVYLRPAVAGTGLAGQVIGRRATIYGRELGRAGRERQLDVGEEVVGASSPTDSRIRVAATVSDAQRARRSHVDSTPPKLVPRDDP